MVQKAKTNGYRQQRYAAAGCPPLSSATRTRTTPNPDLETIRLCGLGLLTIGELLFEAGDLQPTQKILDAAIGSGNTGLLLTNGTARQQA